jgi:chromosomal replication initiator protein
VDEAHTLWLDCAQALRGVVSETVWQTTFNLVEPLAFDGRTLVLGVPYASVKERIEGRFRSLVDDALSESDSPHVLVAVRVAGGRGSGSAFSNGTRWGDGGSDDDAATVPADPGDPQEPLVTNGRWNRPDGGAPTSPSVDGVSARYSFESFVTGASNRFAHAAALSVAETPGRSYNPLFIYGDAGLGKTHLLQAIAVYVQENYPGRQVRYVSTETFLNEFVDAIRTNTTMDFKRRYRGADVLLVDDIQFIEGKEGLQEEFFHTFNFLHEASRQIVISSDRPPDAISTLEDRLRSRFKMGLITDIQPPDLETRLAILRKKAEQMPGLVPDDDVMAFIASNITNNIRELEGALIRVAAFASLNRVPLTMDLAEQVLADTLRDNRPRVITPQLILDCTSARFGFSLDDLCGKSRRRPLVAARQVSMYVMREMTDLSYPGIAKEFGGRDHTTVIHAVEKIGSLMKERRQTYDQVTDLIAFIKSGGPK